MAKLILKRLACCLEDWQMPIFRRPPIKGTSCYMQESGEPFKGDPTKQLPKYREIILKKFFKSSALSRWRGLSGKSFKPSWGSRVTAVRRMAVALEGVPARDCIRRARPGLAKVINPGTVAPAWCWGTGPGARSAPPPTAEWLKRIGVGAGRPSRRIANKFSDMRRRRWPEDINCRYRTCDFSAGGPFGGDPPFFI